MIEFVRRRIERARARSLALRNFDGGQRLLLAMKIFAVMVSIFSAHIIIGGIAARRFPNVAIPAGLYSFAAGIFVFTAILACLYQGHLLFFRFQCSLLELCMLVALMGSLEGLLLSTPGVLYGGHLCWILAASIPPWILHGAVGAYAESSLLGITRSSVRIVLIACNCIALPALTAAVFGLVMVALPIARFANPLVGFDLGSLGPPMLAYGMLMTLPGYTVGFFARRAAKRILREI